MAAKEEDGVVVLAEEEEDAAAAAAAEEEEDVSGICLRNTKPPAPKPLISIVRCAAARDVVPAELAKSWGWRLRQA